MKSQTKSIITGLNCTFLMLTLFLIASCKNKKQLKAENAIERDPKEVAEDKNEKTFISKVDEKDALFLVNATEKNLLEIKLAELALTKFRAYQVKEHATMLLTDHTKILEELTALALRKEIAIPVSITKESEAEYVLLNAKQSGEFDKLYCDLMVEKHQEAIIKFEKASLESSDIEIKDWAAATLATLKNHLEFSKSCRKKIVKINKI